jgi:hypothetical protein
MLARFTALVNDHFFLVSATDVWFFMGMRRWLPGLLLVIMLVVFRLVGSGLQLPNFSPLPAFVLCSLIVLRGSQQWMLPTFAWLLSNPLMNALQGSPLFGWSDASVVLGMAAGAVVVPWAQRKASFLRTQVAVVAAAVLFYFATNSVSFFTMPELYAGNFDGFVQAQWTGPVGMLPTWIFLRNLVAANMIFASVFMLAIPSFSLYYLRPRTEMV